jgi:hypothetical protein
MQLRTSDLHFELSFLDRAKKSSGRLLGSNVYLQQCRKNWKTAQVLILDEISMLAAEDFEMLDYYARRCRGLKKIDLIRTLTLCWIRQRQEGTGFLYFIPREVMRVICEHIFSAKNEQYVMHPHPFGGLQLCIFGDFLQLPPVQKHLKVSAKDDPNPKYRRNELAFGTEVWRKLIRPEHHFELTQVFRQANQPFVDALQEIRRGTPSASTVKLMQTRVGAKLPEVGRGIKPTRLFFMNVDCDAYNDKALKELQTELAVFERREFVDDVEEVRPNDHMGKGRVFF